MAKNFRKFGTMIDCSRNAVITVDSVKKWIDITSDIGYNTVMLYMEDTYEIKGEPFFGHLRGKYTHQELREIDDYAYSKGMEFIPCIQTLAHLNGIFHWHEYRDTIRDCTDILLAEEQGTYDLIDKMFQTFSKTLRTKTINIGMDEAHNLGLGKYLDKHGFKERTKILTDHLKVVSKIAKKYGFNLIMWGDMFVRLANGGEYFVENFSAPQEVKDAIPDNVNIVYWDYYSWNKQKYDNMIKAHASIKDNIWFAGGLWNWGAPTPHNKFSINANKAALSSCIENGVKDVFLTTWGDDGAECSPFALLPALFHAAQVANGIEDDEIIKQNFEQKYGIAFDDFMLLDLPETPNDCQTPNVLTPDKYMLYCDCFTGQYDYTVKGGESQQYINCSQKLQKLEDNKEYGYLFKKAKALSDLLAVKYEIGVRTRKAYLDKDKQELKNIIADYDKLSVVVEKYHKAFQNQWFKENKTFGFEIQDIRLGGLSYQIRSCKERLQDFVDDKIEKIDELNEDVLNFSGIDSPWTSPLQECCWFRIVSANVVSHNVF